MTDELAERLLVKVLEWGPEEVRLNLPVIQALAMWKYDSYERFAPGMRFVESLALWLEQFSTIAERRAAFSLVREKLVFLSEPEMTNLVEMAYPDFIRPYLLEAVSKEIKLQQDISETAKEQAFLIRQRQCLFLGLSDGARTDIFRRCNNAHISHEQILLTYEIEKGRANKLLAELSKGLSQISQSQLKPKMVKFRTAVLLDDFSGSGLSYLRVEKKKVKGKIASFSKNLFGSPGTIGKVIRLTKGIVKAGSPTSKLFDIANLEILVVLYTGTRQAYDHLHSEMRKLEVLYGVRCKIIFVYQFDPGLCMKPDGNTGMEPLIEKYYDKDIESEHTSVGGAEVKYGFAKCGLPLILSHNTPNNSLALLWAETNKMRALFPRAQRHRKQT